VGVHDRLRQFAGRYRYCIYTGIAYGPSVSYLGGATPASDILQDYADDAFTGLGDITDVVTMDGRSDHNGIGFLHCGTNVIRTIPVAEWWNT
jgi:hypothetical protein